MIELLSLLGGGLLRMLPEVLKLFNQRTDHAHELAMTQLQLQIDQARAIQQIDLVHAQAAIAADTAEMGAMVEALKAQAVPSGVKWIDALSSSVRPVLTYWHCMVLYTAYKVAVLMIAMQGGLSWPVAVAQSFNDFDRSIVSSMLAFWFVDRALRRARP